MSDSVTEQDSSKRIGGPATPTEHTTSHRTTHSGTPMEQSKSSKPHYVDIEPVYQMQFTAESANGKPRWISDVELHNTSNHAVAFKVKTTAPKRYLVRPSRGFIDPNAAGSVIVVVNEPSYSEIANQIRDAVTTEHRCKDKFLFQIASLDDEFVQTLQSTDNTNDQSAMLEEFWRGKPTNLQTHKLHCCYDVDLDRMLDAEQSPTHPESLSVPEPEPSSSDYVQVTELAEPSAIEHDQLPNDTKPIWDSMISHSSYVDQDMYTSNESVDKLRRQIRHLRDDVASLETQKQELHGTSDSLKQKLYDMQRLFEREREERRHLQREIEHLKSQQNSSPQETSDSESDSVKQQVKPNAGGKFDLLQLILVALAAYLLARLLH